ncbi:lipoprotein-releasing system ATP-binding protein [Marinilabilia salmonicolor]|jgi:lipoprotein-releasing system ATP-binding protein|uniref:ABC transporter ATP-binding protein n=1 Tax=Marinilabilia salmonicolor TaxID=989 RepID=UPI000D04DB40|nr:ABC transporter ATP-binding protein [Marinilabilia salmonicolor]PRZ00563.1 lipoprotein-releasing system ATP-binding protein [Marinilabilia salmonicolor]
MVEGRNIQKQYGDLKVLKGIDLKIDRGEIVTILGSSGAGKTTLLQILGSLDKPTGGDVFINDTNVSTLRGNQLARFRNEHIGFVFQFHQLLPEFTAIENCMLPGLIARKSEKDSKERALKLLNYLGLSDRLEHKPAELSGGEKQRVAVARALVNDPLVVFADEPSGNLDSRNQDELMDLFVDLRKQFNQTFVIVTHDQHLADKADRTVHIVDGVIVD